MYNNFHDRLITYRKELYPWILGLFPDKYSAISARIQTNNVPALFNYLLKQQFEGQYPIHFEHNFNLPIYINFIE